MKNLTAIWKKASVRERAEFVAQLALYLFVSPRAYLFFYGSSADAMWSWHTFLFGLLLTLAFAATYAAAVFLMKNTTSRERWALFFLSFILIPLPLALASMFAKKLENVWASMAAAVVSYVVLQMLMSILFRYYLLFIDTLVR